MGVLGRGQVQHGGLLQVALGTTNDLVAADYRADKLPEGKHSTRGLGKTHPNPDQSHTM